MAPVPGITISELSRLCDCHLSVARRLFSIGLIEPLPPGDRLLFDGSAVVRARKALRLKRDLGLNFDALALVMELLDRIEDLERRRGSF
jgi:chaperone modulatory protein CbpM